MDTLSFGIQLLQLTLLGKFILPIYTYSYEYEYNKYFSNQSISGQQRLQTELSKLQPATSYATRLCSVGELDSSPFTRPLLFTTLEEGIEFLNIYIYTFIFLIPQYIYIHSSIYTYNIKILYFLNSSRRSSKWIKC